MSIEFDCNRCGKRFSVPAALAGRRAKCKGCETVVTIPGGPEPRRQAPRPTPTVEDAPAEHPLRAASWSGEGLLADAADAAPIAQTSLGSAARLMFDALVALLLMIGFYALALVVAAAFLFLLWMQWRVADRTHQMLGFALTVACGAGAGVILWALVPRFWDSFGTPGVPLDPDEHPKLFQELDAIAVAVGQPLPAEVYLVPDVNAWVAIRGGFLGIGGRRVMGLGLLLMRVLTVSQFRAVLAHEFGHFHAGDTALGPWVHTTRSAIIRTLLGLRVPILRIPFVWYFQLFLWVTQAVSRRQEYAADAVAARAAGSRALINGLRRISAASVAFDPFWQGEVAPVLGAGYRPPFADGFDRFLRQAQISQALRNIIQFEMAHSKSDPYDTHPSLSERVEAVRGLPAGPDRPQDPAAIGLLENGPALERELFATLLPDEKGYGLKPVRWDDVGGRVYLPQWRAHVEKHAEVLTGLTPRALPALARNIKNLGRRLAAVEGREVSGDEAAQLAAGTVGAALAVLLMKRGWSLDAAPGVAVTLRRGQRVIEPFHVLVRLAEGELGDNEWCYQCEQAGIIDVRL